MEYETELKLSTSVQAGPLIESQLLTQIPAQVERRELELSNSYFDTPELDFRKQGMGLRIRGCHHDYEQTIKTAGSGVAGLQQRPEYNVSLGKNRVPAPNVPELSLFPAQIWPADFDLKNIQTQLRCLFSTHFRRSVYLLSFNGQSQIELVWDRGEVNANGQQEAINEMELELKQGDINQLFVVARQIVRLMPVKIGLLSKAARGYRLLNGLAQANVSAKLPMNLNIKLIEQAQGPELQVYLSKVLSRWQQMISQFEQAPTALRLSELQAQWQQLSMILDTCCKVNSQPYTTQLKSDAHNFNDAWQALLLKDWDDSINKADTDLTVTQAAVTLLTGPHAILLQLAIMQYLNFYQ